MKVELLRGADLPDCSAWRVDAVDARVDLVRETAGGRFAGIELDAPIQRVAGSLEG